MKLQVLSLVLPAVILALPAIGQAQSHNVKLIAHVNPPNRGGFSDIWGYTAPDGKEYAIMGCYIGTDVIDPTNPTSPKVTLIPGINSGWRDIKTFGPYAYVVNDKGPGVQILDLRAPASPKLAAEPFKTGAWPHSHNIAMDFDRGHAYVHGTRRGLYILDVKSNPTNPTLLKHISGNYIHDCAIQDGVLHAAEIYNGRYALYDMTTLQKTLIGATQTPSGLTHNVWPSYDNKYAATTDETTGGLVVVYDIQNPKQPKRVSSYHSGSSTTIPHNAYIRDYVLYISHYEEGFRAVDISNPSVPVEVGYYDTYSGFFGGYVGDWGCYPFNESGNVFVSDMDTGLYVVKPRCSPAAYGDATPGGQGAPTAHPFGSAYLGNKSFKIGVRDARPGSIAILLIGPKAGNLKVGPLAVNVDVLAPGAMVVIARTDANGEIYIPTPVPNDTKYDGTKLFAQWVILDSGAKGGLAATRGMEFELFLR